VPAESVVKITDLGGNLVHEGVSDGGQVIWDGRRKSGGPVTSGVYLVFASTTGGQRKQVAKILIIR
jgi:hypothetical protein